MAQTLRDIERLALGERWLDLACSQLASRLRHREGNLIEALADYLPAVAPNPAADGDPAPAGSLREALGACVRCGLSSIEQGAAWSGPLPAEIAAQARSAAEAGVSLETLLLRAAAGYAFSWRIVLAEVGELDISEQCRCALVLHISALLGWLLALVQAEIAVAHTGEGALRGGSRQNRRREIVQKLLDGAPLSAHEHADLDYPLEAWHVAVIAAGQHPRNTLGELAARLGCRLLAIERDESVWGWLAAQHRIAFCDLERAVQLSDARAQRLVVGEPAWGSEGWVQSNREAQAALLVADKRGEVLTRYLDVAADAAALQDKALADSLIERYVAPLERLRLGGAAARQLIGALYDAEHSISSAAHALGLHRSTVHRHRNEIECALGCKLTERQGEIAVALRIAALREGAASN